MKKLVAACALAVASVGVVAPAAHADTAGCVTKSEYRKVNKGMSKTRVHRIFDTDGRREAIARSGRFTSEIRTYRTCSRFSSVALSFGNGQVDGKSAVWVS
jgi:hypothetical protein